MSGAKLECFCRYLAEKYRNERNKTGMFRQYLAKKSGNGQNLNWGKNNTVFFFLTNTKYFSHFSRNKRKQATMV